jgi:hypothetical protein
MKFLRDHLASFLFVLLALTFFGVGKAIPKPDKKAKARLAAVEPARAADFALQESPKGCYAAAGLSLLAAALAWGLRSQPRQTSLHLPTSKWEVASLALLLASAAAYVSPRMTQSLWNDEQQTVADSLLGEVSYNATTGLPIRFRPLPWVDTIFGYHTPNNHMLYSLVARRLHDATAPAESAGGWMFREWVLRLPALLGALGGLMVIWRLARQEFGKLGGITAVVLFALSPWWVRYSSEARGYGMLMGWTALLMLLGLRALRRGDLAAWLWVGAVEFLALYTWPLAAHFIFWLNLGFAGALFTQAGTWSQRWALARPWLAGGVLGLALLLPLVLPLIPQFRRYIQGFPNQTGDGASTLQVFSQYLTGRVWARPSLAHPELSPNWSETTLGWLIFVAVVVVFAVGVRSWWRHLELRWFLLPALIAPATMVAVGRLTGSVFYFWYLAMFSPAAAAMLATGVVSLVKKLPTTRTQIAAAALLCLGYGGVTYLQNKVLLATPAEALRQAAELVGSARFPAAEHSTTASGPIVGMNSAHQIYFPTGRRVFTTEQLSAALQEAQNTGRKFYYVENMVGREEGRGNPMMKILTDPIRFRRLSLTHSFYIDRSVAVYEWLGK